MMLGHVRDNFPRLTLTLPGQETLLNVEFLLDTGFDGELALPGHLIVHLIAEYAMHEFIRMADGTQSSRPVYEILMDWGGESRVTNVLSLDGGVPLLGVELLAEHSVYIEMTDGGDVSIDPL